MLIGMYSMVLALSEDLFSNTLIQGQVTKINDRLSGQQLAGLLLAK